jgi:hypothetical protein
MYNTVITPTEFLVKHLNIGNWNALLVYYSIILLIATIPVIVFIKRKKIWVKISGFVLFFSIFGIGFWLNPIYSNDWEIGGNEAHVEMYQNLFDTIPNKVIVFADPNCYHCEGLLTTLLAMKNQIKPQSILIIFNDLDADQEEKYRAKFSEIFSIISIPYNEFMDYTQGRFPMILLYNQQKKIAQWYNSNLGLKSLDYIVNQCNQ